MLVAGSGYFRTSDWQSALVSTPLFVSWFHKLRSIVVRYWGLTINYMWICVVLGIIALGAYVVLTSVPGRKESSLESLSDGKHRMGSCLVRLGVVVLGILVGFWLAGALF